MQRSTQAAWLIIGWAAAFVLSLLLIPMSQIALGAVIGSAITALVIGAAMKLSVEGLLEETASNLDAINEATPNEQDGDNREHPEIETQTAFKGDFDE